MFDAVNVDNGWIHKMSLKTKVIKSFFLKIQSINSFNFQICEVNLSNLTLSKQIT